ncbi:uncharacterized protein TRAVEDRAFT_47373 [Trametes versicolor FP-101664 SS1]|uniref:uncharacterized protein n=1 Tax=Trametes versicolor (strain FP-101664) TaxID=717944 RepID=UPI0004623D7B|nr:uncharacterized protein TRAVEDRAFT_47373 [Trametes versicolor FP-101664 SS1]EIW58207.1 hypothetical protein TRAVEDRAFT_47373 [Trametes versicolor FP-101664 SS1]
MQILAEAYSTTLHPDALSAAATCLMDVNSDDVIYYFRRLHRFAREHFGAAADSLGGPLAWGNHQELLWLQIILCELMGRRPSLSDDEAAALGVYFRSGWWSSGMQVADRRWAVNTCNAISDHLETAKTFSAAKFVNEDLLRRKKGDLILNARGRETPLADVLLPEITRAYRAVRIAQSRLTEASADAAKAAHTGYLESVAHFLECAHPAWTSTLPASDLDTVYPYTRDVLAELTRVLLELFAADKVRTTIESGCLASVLGGLRGLDDARLQKCVPEDLVLGILDLAETLESASEYADNKYVREVQHVAAIFGKTIIRVHFRSVKHKPGTTASPETSPKILLGTTAAAPAGVADSSTYTPGAADKASCTGRDPGDDSQNAHAGDAPP